MRIPRRIAGKKHNAQQRSLQQEKELAKRIGGRTVRGSGRGNEKGDVRIEKILRIEAKTTSKSSFSVSLNMIEKIESAAMSAGECPAIVVEFLDANGKPISEVAVVPTWALNSITSK